MLGLGHPIEGVTPGEQVNILAAMALRGGDEAQGAVAVLGVVPAIESIDPGAGVIAAREGLFGEPWMALEGIEQRLTSCGLSSLTEGRLKEGTTPRRCKVASLVAPFMGAPLSECRTSASARTPSRRWALRKPPAACSADSLA